MRQFKFWGIHPAIEDRQPDLIGMIEAEDCTSALEMAREVLPEMRGNYRRIDVSFEVPADMLIAAELEKRG